MIKGIIFDFNRTLYNPETSKLEEGALEVLDELTNQSIQLCLISKKSSGDRRKQISELGLDKYFKDIQVIEDEKEESHLQYCLEVMGLASEEVAVVGDRIIGEIRLGNKLGMTTIRYKKGKLADMLPQNEYEQADHTIKRLDEVLEIVKT